MTTKEEMLEVIQENIGEIYEDYVIFPKHQIVSVNFVKLDGEEIPVRRFTDDIIYLYEPVIGNITIEYIYNLIKE